MRFRIWMGLLGCLAVTPVWAQCSSRSGASTSFATRMSCIVLPNDPAMERSDVVAVKAGQANAFLKTVDPRVRAVLFFGPDAGLVSERSEQLAKKWANLEQPAGEIIRIDDETALWDLLAREEVTRVVPNYPIELHAISDIRLVPEPSSVWLVGAGLAALAKVRRVRARVR